MFAHTFNFELLIDAHDASVNGTLASALTNLPTSPDGTWINPIRTYPTVRITICAPQSDHHVSCSHTTNLDLVKQQY